MLRVLPGLAMIMLLVTASGCDLFDDELTFTVDTDWKQMTMDSSSLGISIPSGSAIPAIPCSKSDDICAKATSGITCNSSKYSCELTCSELSKCEITASVEENSLVDLSSRIQSQTSATALSKVSLTRVVYNTVENSLTFDTPQIEIFVGPHSAGKTTSPGVVKFATMPPIPKGKKIDNEIEEITEAGREALSNFVKDYKTPFRFFLKASMSFSTGDMIPQGLLTIRMKAYFQITPLS